MQETNVQLNRKDFKKQLEQYIQFRGIDIILHLKDGTVMELDKNRRMEGDLVVQFGRDGNPKVVPLDEIMKVDFYAA